MSLATTRHTATAKTSAASDAPIDDTMPSTLSTGNPKLNTSLERSIASVRKHVAVLDANGRMTMWSTMANAAAKLPFINHSSKWPEFEVKLVCLIKDTESAYVFLEDVDSSTPPSRRPRCTNSFCWWMSALVAATKSNLTRDELETQRALYDWIS